jgi:hypothetical protein
MAARVAFLVGPRGDGFDAAAAALAAHPDVHVAREAHVLTAFAHLGYYDKVHRAPYDHILAAEAQRLFVDRLPSREADYLDACRAYCGTLYARALEATGKTLLVDATPEYAGILPFLCRVLPDAPCVAVTRHPLALLAVPGTSPATVRRLVEAVAALGRRGGAHRVLLRAEDLGREPQAALEPAVRALGIDLVPAMAAAAAEIRLSPPEEWAPRAAERLPEAQRLVKSLSRDDLAAYGYSIEDIWGPLEAVTGRRTIRAVPRGPRRLLGRLRSLAQRPGRVNRVLRRVRLAADVLLRPGG